MLVKVVGKRPVAIVPGTVPMESVDLEFRGDDWTHIECIIVSSDEPEKEQVERAARAILRRHGKPETFELDMN